MSLVVSQNLVLSAVEIGTDRPLVGWRNIVTASNIAADTADSNNPASNLANPATFLGWLAADTTEQYVTITPGTADAIDYVGIATHNLSTAQIAVSIEGDGGSGYAELVAPAIPANDGPLLFRFTAQALTGLRIKLASGDAAASIAVVYAGKLLVMQHKMYQGFPSPSDAEESSVTNGRSQSGNFLGSIVTGRKVALKLPFSLYTPDWERANFRPWLQSGRNDPFFFVWRPDTYPDEVGYLWLSGATPKPQPQSPHSLLSWTMDVEGVV
jgi:hypothetical protein